MERTLNGGESSRGKNGERMNCWVFGIEDGRSPVMLFRESTTMKPKRLITLLSVIVIVIGGWLYFNSRSGSVPELVFKGYQTVATDGQSVAKFELRNTTRKTIWLCYLGRGPLGPPFLRRSAAASQKPTSHWGTNIIVTAGSFFEGARNMRPGDRVELEFPLRSDDGPQQVGIMCYGGSFTDSNDFLSQLSTPTWANWKGKAAFYWHKLNRRLKGFKRYDVWCPTPVQLPT